MNKQLMVAALKCEKMLLLLSSVTLFLTLLHFMMDISNLFLLIIKIKLQLRIISGSFDLDFGLYHVRNSELVFQKDDRSLVLSKDVEFTERNGKYSHWRGCNHWFFFFRANYSNWCVPWIFRNFLWWQLLKFEHFLFFSPSFMPLNWKSLDKIRQFWSVSWSAAILKANILDFCQKSKLLAASVFKNVRIWCFFSFQTVK